MAYSFSNIRTIKITGIGRLLLKLAFMVVYLVFIFSICLVDLFVYVCLFISFYHIW